MEPSISCYTVKEYNLAKMYRVILPRMGERHFLKWLADERKQGSTTFGYFLSHAKRIGRLKGSREKKKPLACCILFPQREKKILEEERTKKKKSDGIRCSPLASTTTTGAADKRSYNSFYRSVEKANMPERSTRLLASSNIRVPSFFCLLRFSWSEK